MDIPPQNKGLITASTVESRTAVTMFTTHIEKDKEGFYTSVDPHFLDHCGMPHYNPDERWKHIPFSMGLPEHVREKLAEIENAVHKNKKPISSTGLWKPADKMLQVITHRKPICGGGFTTLEHVSMVEELYEGWPMLLNFHLQVLVLPNGKNLTRKDLKVLHFFTLGLPRKMIAHGTQSSAKSVERRLAKIKDILDNDLMASHGLRNTLHYLRLVPFLLAEPDWFAIEERIHVHAAHNLDIDK